MALLSILLDDGRSVVVHSSIFDQWNSRPRSTGRWTDVWVRAEAAGHQLSAEIGQLPGAAPLDPDV